jgi:hypothetical protein
LSLIYFRKSNKSSTVTWSISSRSCWVYSLDHQLFFFKIDFNVLTFIRIPHTNLGRYAAIFTLLTRWLCKCPRCRLSAQLAASRIRSPLPCHVDGLSKKKMNVLIPKRHNTQTFLFLNVLIPRRSYYWTFLLPRYLVVLTVLNTKRS